MEVPKFTELSGDAYFKHKMFADESMLRDFFAAMAMQKIIGFDLTISRSIQEAEMNKRSVSEQVAIDSYKLADAMILERNKRND